MVVVLDTASFRRLTRGVGMADSCTAIDPALERKCLKLAVDRAGSLIDEWRQTCGCELVEVLINHWEPLKALVVIDAPGALDQRARKRLNQLGFKDTIDKLVVRLACHTADRTIVSDDGHFWDPNPALKGDPAGVTASTLARELDITVMVLATLIQVCHE